MIISGYKQVWAHRFYEDKIWESADVLTARSYY